MQGSSLLQCFYPSICCKHPRTPFHPNQSSTSCVTVFTSTCTPGCTTAASECQSLFQTCHLHGQPSLTRWHWMTPSPLCLVLALCLVLPGIQTACLGHSKWYALRLTCMAQSGLILWAFRGACVLIASLGSCVCCSGPPARSQVRKHMRCQSSKSLRLSNVLRVLRLMHVTSLQQLGARVSSLITYIIGAGMRSSRLHLSSAASLSLSPTLSKASSMCLVFCQIKVVYAQSVVSWTQLFCHWK